MDNERIRYTACPLCQSTDIRALATVNCTGHAMWREPLEPYISWVECGSCDHVFTEGYFTEAALDHIARQHPRYMQVVGNDIEYHRNISAKMVQRVVEALGLPDDRLWLDIGFGNGSLLMTAKEFGFEVFGIDLRKKNVEDLQELGIPAHHGTLASAIAEVAFKPSRR